ncbi:hypothetical protein Cylst_6444 (plasmid) [Cylindrospermum stagnale PCC 7417]|uniref:Uncharacterized protein n=1 Tax=Cylindrospermum stagnale PCC 7417 TaxID=56107 RepID=K9X6E4_9NOST|nr:hypothetical protein Cylst_6444 [Cylindrospermum stagnale PCC 7417]
MNVGDKVQHISAETFLGESIGWIVWMHNSGTFCDVQFDLPRITALEHPVHANRTYNRFNDPVRLPSALLKLVL